MLISNNNILIFDNIQQRNIKNYLLLLNLTLKIKNIYYKYKNNKDNLIFK